jgi:hypothetical protein
MKYVRFIQGVQLSAVESILECHGRYYFCALTHRHSHAHIHMQHTNTHTLPFVRAKHTEKNSGVKGTK